MTALTDKDWELFTQTVALDTEQYTLDSARAIEDEREATKNRVAETEFYEP